MPKDITLKDLLVIAASQDCALKIDFIPIPRDTEENPDEAG